MNWLTERVMPKIRALGVRSSKETPDNLWRKCPSCGQMLFTKDLEAAQFVCGHCGHHMRVGAKQRFTALFDDGQYQLHETPDVPIDPLKFRDSKKYPDRLKDARAKNGVKDAVQVASGALGGRRAVIAVQDFAFLGGSMGLAVGEALVSAALLAVKEHAPLVVFSGSGGARMQEGILSLMQMPRTVVAVQRLREARLPFIMVLTDPTTGGVTASYAMLGDVHIAEPNALIGFAGPRVIEQTIRETLPEGFQRSEYLLDHGMIDMVVPRQDLKATLVRLVALLMDGGKPPASSIEANAAKAIPHGSRQPRRAQQT